MKTSVRIIVLSLIVIAVTASAQTVHHGEVAANGSLYFRAEPLNNVFNGKEDNVYYYVHLQGLDKVNTTVKEHVPVNISVVLDRSGSMDGDKLSYAKEALKYVIQQLDSRDVLSVVLHDTDVEVFLTPQRIENKTELLQRVDKIKIANSTNLEGGIRKGYELVKSAKKLIGAEMINRVLLLSDGHANVGVTDPEALSAITRTYFQEDHISISTFGVGNDYNENLMAKIAQQGGGMYYFIYSPEKLPAVFSEEMKGLSHVVAKNAVLKITFPDEILSYERTFAFGSTLKGNTLELTFGDLFANEQKAILIRFKTKNKLKTAFVIEAALHYDNSNTEPMLALNDVKRSELKPAADEKEFENGFNHSASEGYALELSSELYDEAVEAANSERYTEAKTKVKEATTLLDLHFKRNGENLFLREFDTKLKEYEKLIDDMKHMDRETFHYNVKLFKESSAKRKIRAKF
jgi:Ca-activated chloride channel homolog